jgi:hypothetical protein
MEVDQRTLSGALFSGQIFDDLAQPSRLFLCKSLVAVLEYPIIA